MTPEEAARRAVACTAIGKLSGLPKFEWIQTSRVSRTDDCDETVTSRGGILLRVLFNYETIAVYGDDGRYYHANTRFWIPDFTHIPTVLNILPLVHRAWIGYDVRLIWRTNDVVDLTIERPRFSLNEIRQLAVSGNKMATQAYLEKLANGDDIEYIVRNAALYEALTIALESAPSE